METELSLRSKSCWMIEEVGMALAKSARSAPSSQSNNGRLTISTACLLFHRFYSIQSFKIHDRHIIGLACLFLSGKIEESPRKLKDIILLFFTARFKRNPDETESKDWHDKVIIAERVLLHTLRFELLVQHPYGPCISLITGGLKRFISEDRFKDVRQFAFNVINDSFRTTLCLQYSHKDVATAAVFLTLLTLELQPVQSIRKGSQQSIPEEKSWLDLVQTSISEVDLRDICHQIVEVYEMKQKHGPESLNVAAIRHSMSIVFSDVPESADALSKVTDRNRSRTLSNGDDTSGAVKRKRSMSSDETNLGTTPKSSSILNGTYQEINVLNSGTI